MSNFAIGKIVVGPNLREIHDNIASAGTFNCLALMVSMSGRSCLRIRKSKRQGS